MAVDYMWTQLNSGKLEITLSLSAREFLELEQVKFNSDLLRGTCKATVMTTLEDQFVSEGGYNGHGRSG